MNFYRRFTEWFFSVPEGARSRWNIIVWWELRRIPYNIIVGTLGIISLYALYFFTAREPIKNGEDTVEPFALLLAPFVINLCYTAGWIVEGFFPPVFLESFLVERKHLGPKFLRTGLWASVVILFLPTTLWGISWISQLAGFGRLF